MAETTTIQPVDEVLPAPQLIVFGLQHVLVMAASPITAAFLVSRALGFTPELTLNLISATFLVCGLGKNQAEQGYIPARMPRLVDCVLLHLAGNFTV